MSTVFRNEHEPNSEQGQTEPNHAHRERIFQHRESLKAMVDLLKVVGSDGLTQVDYIHENRNRTATLKFFELDVALFREVLGEVRAKEIIRKILTEASAIANQEIVLSSLHEQLSMRRKEIQVHRFSPKQLWKTITREVDPHKLLVCADISGGGFKTVAFMAVDPKVVSFKSGKIDDQEIEHIGVEGKKLFTLSSLQNRGIGKRLLKMSKEIVYNRLQSDMLVLVPNNQRAMHFFESNGFSNYGPITVEVGTDNIKPQKFIFHLMVCNMLQLAQEVGNDFEDPMF